MQTPNSQVSSPRGPQLRPRNLFEEFARLGEQDRVFNNLARIGNPMTATAVNPTEWRYIPLFSHVPISVEVDSATKERVKDSLSRIGRV